MRVNQSTTDLSRFNNKYLKCIVTKRKSTMDILKDHGAVIIYNRSGYNYLYLGNEFIAGGWGYKTQDDLESAVNILNNYDTDITTLTQNIEYLNNDMNSMKKTLGDISEKLNPTVYIVDENGEVIPLNEIIFRGRPAEYKNFEIVDIEKIIIYNQNQKLELKKDENLVEFPIGTIINKITYNINCNINDCGGVREVNMSYYASSDDAINQISTPLSVNNLQWANLDNKKIISIVHEFIDPFRIDKGEDLAVVNKIMISLNETAKEQYKEYPDLVLSNPKFKLYSLENILRSQDFYIEPLVIHPINSLKYYINRELEQNMNDIKYSLENSTDRYAYKGEIQIRDIEPGEYKDIFIPVRTQYAKVINIFLPKSFEIHEVRFVTTTSEYNWTGATGICKENTNGSPILLRYNPRMYLKYNFYQVRISESPLSEVGKLMIRIFSKTNDYSEDVFAGNGEGIYFTEPQTWTLLNNEEFNRIYWVTYNSSIDTLKDRLDVVSSKF